MYQSAEYDYLLTSKKQLVAYNLFWVGFVIYTFMLTLLSLGLIASFRIIQLVQGFGIVIFTLSTLRLVNFRIENIYLKIVYLLYLLWLLGIIMRGFHLNYQYLNNSLFDDYDGLFPYLAPIVLLFPQKISLYKRIFQVVVVLALLYLVLDVYDFRILISRDISDVKSRNAVESLSRHLALPCGFILLTYSYQIKQVKYLAWIVVTLTILLAIVRARRGMLFSLAAPVSFTCIIYFLESKKKTGVFFVALFSLFIIAIYGMQFFSESSFFNSFKSRVGEDTRSGVEECLYNDMKGMDWIVGKGINGTYYCPSVDPSAKTNYRSIIETDYLNVILKGGIISISLLLLISIPAAVKGIFYSNNNLGRASGFWILLWLLSLYPTTVVAFNMNYLLFWIAIAICYSKKIRKIPDEILKTYFSKLAIVANNPVKY